MKAGEARAQQQYQMQAQQQAAVEQARQEGAAQAQQQAPAAPPAKDVTAELQKLAELHKSGVLSAEEFAAAKKKLLGI
jgi:membrane protease subunit (stomatin/prohibitin family)